jgi:hypothetical protein
MRLEEGGDVRRRVRLFVGCEIAGHHRALPSPGERHVPSARRRQRRLQLQHGDGEIADVDGGGGVSKGCRRRSLAEALACLRLIITW